MEECNFYSCHSSLVQRMQRVQRVQRLEGEQDTICACPLSLSGTNHMRVSNIVFVCVLSASCSAVQLQTLKTKAKIFVPKGRWLLGTVDETKTLQVTHPHSPPQCNI